MLDVFFTVDVEIWCDGWNDLDNKFNAAFKKYIYGPTPKGDFGLPYQIERLKDHGLTGVFFIEPLFSTCFGSQPLEEISGLVQMNGQEVQLHLHTEWVDESKQPLLENINTKRQHLRYFSVEEQTILVSEGIHLLKQAGAGNINAFRAGSFGFNSDTLSALYANSITYDSSYNATMFGPDSGVMPGTMVVEPIEYNHVFEYPITVFKDGMNTLRHVQLTACSFEEIERLLWNALESRRKAFVILSHSFELLNKTKTRPDNIVVNRFRKLCSFLDRNRDSFRVCGFSNLCPKHSVKRQPAPLEASFWSTGKRIIEQIYRRKYQ